MLIHSLYIYIPFCSFERKDSHQVIISRYSADEWAPIEAVVNYTNI